jgi:hypothetical protein
MRRKLAWTLCLAAAALVWCRCGGQRPEPNGKEPADEKTGERALTEEERLAGEAFDAQAREAPIKKTGEHTYALDGIRIDTKTKQIRFAAVVNQTNQELPLEVLLCTEYGKTHEALFRTAISPTYLNVAFKLLGCHGGKPRLGVGDPAMPVGSPVEIVVKWTDAEGKTTTVEPEAWIWNHKTKAPMQPTHWTYTGSMFHMGKFMAQATGTIVNVYVDPSTLVEPPIPEVHDDTVFGVHAKVVPPEGTVVELIFTALPEEAAEETGETETDDEPRSDE